MKAAGQDSAEAWAKVKEWTAKKRDFLQNRVDLPLVKSQNGGIMRLRGDPVTISSIEKPVEKPIEQRNSSRGKPSAIMHFDVELNTRQKAILEKLPEYDSREVFAKNDVNMSDLSVLTAKTGDEFALFTREGKRLVIRGNSSKVNIGKEEAIELNRHGYIWSGHTHPGADKNCLLASDGDMLILSCFDQQRSVIYNSVGDYRDFWKE